MAEILMTDQKDVAARADAGRSVGVASPSPLTWAVGAAVLAGFLGLMGWFKGYDLYHSGFNTSGLVVLFYNALRVLFVGYLFLAVAGAGALLFRFVARLEFGAASPLARLCLAWFAGAGIIHIVMLAAGLAHLFTPIAAVILTAPLVVVGYLFLASLVRDGLVRFSIGGVAVLLAAAGLMLMKGLYPSGGHDYFVHYFPYFQQVIADQGIEPNQIWYHYFYSKGAGLHFLAMLLTDPLGPQLSTMTSILAGAGAIHLLAKRLAPQGAWSWILPMVFLAIYIHTPGELEHRINGGWGDFEKLHEINTGLFAGILWTATEALTRMGRERLPWLAASALAIVAAVLIEAAFALILGGLFVFAAIWFFVSGTMRRAPDGRASAILALGLATVTGAVLFAVFALNYAATGLILDQPLLLTWRIADAEKLFQWGALFPVIQTHHDLSGARAISVPPFDFLMLMVRSLRLPYLAPLLIAAVIAAFLAKGDRNAQPPSATPTPATRPAFVLLGAGFVALLILGYAGAGQPISFYRLATFSIVIILVLCAAIAGLWQGVAAPDAPQSRSRLVEPGLPAAAAAICGALVLLNSGFVEFAIAGRNALRFGTGALSIDAAYSTQDGLAGHAIFGGIYPGARGVYEHLGPNVPVFALNNHAYCMLPDCKIMQTQAFALSHDFDRVIFGSPEEAREKLQAAGLNYFLYTREDGLQDIIAMAPLFDSKRLGEYLGIEWTDGTTALLTWKSDKTAPFDEDWRAAYEKSECSACGYEYDKMKAVWDKLRVSPHPWTRPDLPW